MMLYLLRRQPTVPVVVLAGWVPAGAKLNKQTLVTVAHLQNAALMIHFNKNTFKRIKNIY